MTAVLAAKKLSKSFLKEGHAISVLRDVDLQVEKGEMIAITGASGAGKSTLLHVLGTLESPTSGEVFYGSDQQRVFSLSEKELALFRNRQLGFVFQFHYLLPEFSAVENVMMPALIGGYPARAALKQAEALLDFVGLNHRKSHRPSELSGGEQQRVAIARAVIMKPSLLLADELTGNLDSENSANIIRLLRDLNRATQVAVILVTHDRTLAAQMHRVLVMKDGNLSA